MNKKQPREIYFLLVLAIVFSNMIWIARMTLELKVLFTFLLCCMVLVFGRLFFWLETLKVENS